MKSGSYILKIYFEGNVFFTFVRTLNLELRLDKDILHGNVFKYKVVYTYRWFSQ